MTYFNKKKNVEFLYSLNGTTLDDVDYFKDLGVGFDCKLNFNQHIGEITVDAWRMWGFIYRNCKQFWSLQILLLSYKSMISPRLEYCSPVWSPDSDIATKAIETIEHEILRQLSFVAGTTMPFNDHDYDPILSRTNLLTLASRCDHTDVMFLHKLLNNCVECSEIFLYINFCVPRPNSKKREPFVVDRFRTNIGVHCTISRAMSIANRISPNVNILSCSEFCLKSMLLLSHEL